MIPKFRAWHAVYGMSEPFLLFWGEIEFPNPKSRGMTLILNRDDSGFDIIMENCQIMLSTDLKDKNGKEIFEGDIVSSTNMGGIIERESAGTWIIRRAKKCGTILCFDKRHEEIIVVGNIYENPEMWAV
jgi:uncharacterized phage protein (TIGR01671 family)